MAFDCDGAFRFPDGTSEPTQAKAGQAIWTDATEHLPENKGTSTLEVLLVELKS